MADNDIYVIHIPANHIKSTFTMPNNSFAKKSS